MPFIDKHGNPVDDDLCPDGGKVATNMKFMDNSPYYTDAMKRAFAQANEETDEEADEEVEDAVDDPIEQAYRARSRRYQAAYKNPGPVKASPAPARQHDISDAESAWLERNRQLSEAWRKR